MYFYEKKPKNPETKFIVWKLISAKRKKREVVGEVIIFNHLQVKVAIPM